MFCYVCLYAYNHHLTKKKKKETEKRWIRFLFDIVDTENKLLAGGFPYLSSPPPPPSGCALSLLSSSKSADHYPWLSPADLSVRCSAALRELIAENRAAAMAKQIILERDWHYSHQHHHHHHQEDEDDDHNKEIPLQYNFNFSQQQHQIFP